MDAPANEVRLLHRRRFQEFLDTAGQYGDKIRDMMNANEYRLVVDVNDLRAFDSELLRKVLDSPSDYIQPFEEALGDVIRNTDSKYLTEQDEVKVGFTGSFGFHRLSPRQLLSPFLGKLVQVEGIITKCSLVHPKVVKSVHHCATTGEFISREYRDATSTAGLPTSSVYPTKDENGNLLTTEYGLCKYRDNQTISIQEMPENAPAGQLPRSVDIVLEDDLVDMCKPGDRVSIVGIYKAVPPRQGGAVSGTCRTILVGNALRHLRREVDDGDFTPEDIRFFKKLAQQEPKQLYRQLGASLAPSIAGHDDVKQALVLLLLGGVEKNLANGGHLRGDINCLMVGDPSVAKSQLLRAVMKIAPLSISTTGRGSSGVGLTAAVTTDNETGERRLEAGAMVLADRGVVCIDEFDKMSDEDRVAIHEVMEQQTVTIAKAGIHASLNARCSVVAAANPIYGSYDLSISVARNVALPDSLLSRFDLLFILIDKASPVEDRIISSHVLQMHMHRAPGDDGRLAVDNQLESDVQFDDGADDRENTGRYAASIYTKGSKKKEDKPISSHNLKKFISYAKNRPVTQVLTQEAMEHIADSYAQIRHQVMQGEDPSSLPVTARTLETLIRLATAHAKMRLARDVELQDAKAAVRLLQDATLLGGTHKLIEEKKENIKDAHEKKAEEDKKRKAEAEAAEAAQEGAAAEEGAEERSAEGAGAGAGAEQQEQEQQEEEIQEPRLNGGVPEPTAAQSEAFDRVITRLFARESSSGTVTFAELGTAIRQELAQGAGRRGQAPQVTDEQVLLLAKRYEAQERVMVDEEEGTVHKI